MIYYIVASNFGSYMFLHFYSDIPTGFIDYFDFFSLPLVSLPVKQCPSMFAVYFLWMREDSGGLVVVVVGESPRLFTTVNISSRRRDSLKKLL